MANSYFQFKKFKIEQSNCAQKVCTEACLFGAILSRQIQDESTILDIGSGTGLLALMIAQDKEVKIDAIEIDTTCAEQSRTNVKLAENENTISIQNADIRLWKQAKNYDWIISNPPFFNNSLPSNSIAKNQARQASTLIPKDWDTILQKHANNESQIALLLAENELSRQYRDVLENAGFYVFQEYQIWDNPNRKNQTIIWIASAQVREYKTTRIVIKNDDQSYSDEFKELLYPFYLHF